MCCSKRTINAPKTNKYFIMNGKVLAEKKRLSEMIGEMQLHIAELENKFKASEVMGNGTSSSNQEPTRIEYFTDADKLAEETEWISQK